MIGSADDWINYPRDVAAQAYAELESEIRGTANVPGDLLAQTATVIERRARQTLFVVAGAAIGLVAVLALVGRERVS